MDATNETTKKRILVVDDNRDGADSLVARAAGSRLAIGSAVIEISETPSASCSPRPASSTRAGSISSGRKKSRT